MTCRSFHLYSKLWQRARIQGWPFPKNNLSAAKQDEGWEVHSLLPRTLNGARFCDVAQTGGLRAEVGTTALPRVWRDGRNIS